MDIKSIRGGLILMMLLLAVNAVEEENKCPCKDEKDSVDMVAECKKTSTCLDDNEEQCQQPVHVFAKILTSDCGLLNVCLVTAYGEYLGNIFNRASKGEKMDEDKLKQEVMTYTEKKYPCLLEQGKKNEKCSDEASAKKCFSKVTKKSECVDVFLEKCKEGESLTKMAQESSNKKSSAGIHKYFVGFIIASLFML